MIEALNRELDRDFPGAGLKVRDHRNGEVPDKPLDRLAMVLQRAEHVAGRAAELEAYLLGDRPKTAQSREDIGRGAAGVFTSLLLLSERIDVALGQIEGVLDEIGRGI